MQMDEKISRKNIEEILSYNVAAERNPVVRVLPLFIKNIGIRFMFHRSRRSVTATLSNLGRMEIDPEYSSKLQRFHAMMGVFSGQEFKCTVIDMTLGNSGWLFSYASPGMVMMANAAIFVLVLANRKNWHSYVVYQAILTVCNLLMNGFYMTGWIKNPLVLWISCGLSVIMTIILMVSGHRKGMKELKRRFYA